MRSRVLIVAVFAVIMSAAPPRAQDPSPSIAPKPAHKVSYLMPLWLYYQSVGQDEVAEQVRQLRERLGGDGQYMRLGFTVYIFADFTSWTVDPNNSDAVRAELTGVTAQIDNAIARALPHNLPICLSVLTALRERYDEVQRLAEREDRRNTQWYSTNDLSNGWVTHSRYARRLRRVQEAYVREIGKIIADRMARYPNIVVAASGDGEVELSFERSPIVNPAYTVATAQLADYSPFGVLEFRDWARNGGMYAAGQPFEGQGYENAARYDRDPSPGADGNGDGRTFNGDFSTSFSTWDLRYFHWDLSDNPEGDPNAIPASRYEAPGFNSRPDAGATRFDPPRQRQPGNTYWNLWVLFKQSMIWRHNVDFARWMTTSADPASGLTIPAERFFSDQIPADYIFGGTPQSPTFRYDTSASTWWTADISPYGSLGLTAFSTYDPATGQIAPTLRNVAPVVAQRQVRWGILEFHSAVPLAPNIQVYRDDMDVLERYRAALTVPIYWGDPYYQIQNTPFEQAMREWVVRTKDTPPRAADTPEPIRPFARSSVTGAGDLTSAALTTLRETLREKRARQTPDLLPRRR